MYKYNYFSVVRMQYTITVMGCSPISKLLFPNGSYLNGVCRALWAVSHLELSLVSLLLLNRFKTKLLTDFRFKCISDHSQRYLVIYKKINNCAFFFLPKSNYLGSKILKKQLKIGREPSRLISTISRGVIEQYLILHFLC